MKWVAHPSPGDLPNPGIELKFPALSGCFFTTEHQGRPATVKQSIRMEHTKEKKINTFFFLRVGEGSSRSPIAKTSPSNAGGTDLIPDQGANIPQALQSKTRNRNMVTNSKKDFKNNGPHKKIFKEKRFGGDGTHWF